MLRNAYTSLAGPSTMQRTVILPSVMQVHPRHLHSTSPALKKRRATEVEEDFDTSDEAAADELSLFDDAEAATSPGATFDRKSHRATIIQSINSVAATTGRERRGAASALRVGSLRKVAQLSDTQEEIEELKSVLRTWRVLGGKVTLQTAKEIVGRCCNLGRPDLAQEFLSNRVQFGFPAVPSASQQKLDAALANYTAPPSTSATESGAST